MARTVFGLFNGQNEAEQAARHLAEASGVPESDMQIVAGGEESSVFQQLVDAGLAEEQARLYAKRATSRHAMLIVNADVMTSETAGDSMQRHGMVPADSEQEAVSGSGGGTAQPSGTERWKESSKVGTGLGAASGAVSGAAMGTLGGPVGTVIGGIAGAISGAAGGGLVDSISEDLAHDDRALKELEERTFEEKQEREGSAGSTTDNV